MSSTTPWLHPAIDGKHVVSMTREYPDGGGLSVATCQCGWQSKVPTDKFAHAVQDNAVDAHWQSEIGEFDRKAVAS